MTELRVALIGGGGFMGQAHSLGWALTSALDGMDAVVHRQVLVDATDELAAEEARIHGWAESSSDWRAVIARPDIDIIDIVTPPHLHEEIALAAIAAGKHVFVEKPVTNNATQALEMHEAARAAGVANQVGFNYRHTPAVLLAKQLIDEGRIGTTLQYRASYLLDGFFFFAGRGWRAEKSTGGSGSVGDIGSHIIDMAEYLNGDIVRVCAQMRTREKDDDGWLPEADRLGRDLVDSSAVWLAEFANGGLATFAANGYSSGNKNHIRFELDGSKGGLRFDWNHREELEVSLVEDGYRDSGFRTIITNREHDNVWYSVAGLGFGYLDGTAVQMRDFVSSIVNGGTAHPNFGEAAHVQQVVEAVEESARTGAWIDVPRRPAGSDS